ncbi:max-binding protein MNT-like isoform X2 [Sitophilus oryzae]|uniref:Max-binding protein MNT n=1 Tax=Sitophilus oryzae TaxID=7048 RepID=A0A6J2Y242_SITOR|nr:max-binding protein MNT-like isoform X2 [Sitophilus oryzae]
MSSAFRKGAQPEVAPFPSGKTPLSNVKIILFQPLADSNDQEKMSLNTLIEAAKFLEMQEQAEQQHRATLETALAGTNTTTIRPVTSAVVNGGQNAQLQNGTTGSTITLQPIKLINSTTSPQTNIGTIQNAQPTQTVVISSNNISSTFLQGVQGPISFATATPITSTPQTSSQNNGVSQSSLIQPKKEQDGHISSTTLLQSQRHRILNNSFDIMNPLVIDESNPADQKKIRQPPLVFRSGTREVHNKLEKHRRAHLKECFDVLKKQLPSSGDEKKTSNLSILHSSLRFIQTLKRRERELEHEMERLAREKISHQQRLASLKKDISSHFDNVDFSKLLPDIPPSATSLTQNNVIHTKDVHTSITIDRGTVTSPVDHTKNIVISCIESTRSEQIPTTSICSSEMGHVNGGSAAAVSSSNAVISQSNSVIATNGENKISIPILSKSLPIVTQAPAVTSIKEVSQPVQTTGISVLPMPYPVNQGLVLQKVAIVPHKGITDLTPLVSTHFITTPQQLNGISGQLNGKVVPLTQYVVKPVVVVSTASPRTGS